MMELSFNNVKKYLDANLVLENICFSIYDTERVGIVGVNGSGKSTILKIIAGVEKMTRDDEGFISIPRGKSIGYLEQVDKYDNNIKVNEILKLAFSELEIMEEKIKFMEKEMKHLQGGALEKTLEKYSDIQQSYEIQGGYEKEEKLSKVCTGLNFDDSFLDKDFSILSGGEKTTVILGKILLESPEILLLDEPTNHLDMKATEWIEDYLKSYKGMVIIVSHDRYFLDNVVGKIIEIEDMECETYKGNYSEFVKQKEYNMLIQFHQFKEQQKKIAAMEKTIKDLRDWAQRADNNKFFKRAASIQKKLDKMQKIKKPKFDKQNIKLDFNDVERSGNQVIIAKNLSKSYEEKQLFNESNLLINFKDRAALIGGNGSGKTTFLKMLLGEEATDGGNVRIGDSVKSAYLPQNITFKDEELTVVDCFREDFMILEGKAREYLSKFMFFGSDVFKKVNKLSGGERVRLKLSKLLYEDINLLILDEPTNHLDIDSIEALEESLEYFKGTILFISHDRYFINKMSSRIIEIDNKTFKNYLGNYDYYKEEKDKIKVQFVEEKKEKKEKTKIVRKVDGSQKIDKKIAKLEEQISILEEKIREIDEEMSSLKDNYSELNELYINKEELENQLYKMMEDWETITMDSVSEN
ncbi:ribosomal protection-like ABC-F family protein [Clostridium gasigenes]|uniref:ribosomal protection-like ABC-F family protein n=1 Tax=Clostridium gasigenes TaxID=94869 RepID=UPI001C0C4F66|nr:ABC-F type ribosomal protection protein [Clostridium gasigenes]MBU3109300.1 ABC-F type ribosomal protection protein [Clostridium gasigenes]